MSTFGSGTFGSGTFGDLPGDALTDPLSMLGPTGSLDLTYLGGSVEPAEPALAPGGDPATFWLLWAAPAAPGTLSIEVDAAHFVEVYDLLGDGAAFNDLQPVNLYANPNAPLNPPALYAVTNATLRLPTGGDQVYMLRTYSNGPASPFTLTWSWVERVTPLVLIVHNDLASLPGYLSVSVSGADPGENVLFSVPSDPLFIDFDADTGGVLARVSVPIEAPLAVGTHVLSATTVRGAAGTATFSVLSAPQAFPQPLPTIPLPGSVTQSGVRRWIVQSRTGAVITNWVFPMNPSEATSPYAPRPFALRTTTSPGGQALTWEGAIRAHEWTLTGYLNTQDHYQKLEALVASEQRYWMIDHRSQWRLVSFESFEPTYRRTVAAADSLNDWSFGYTLGVLVYRHFLELTQGYDVPDASDSRWRNPTFGMRQGMTSGAGNTKAGYPGGWADPDALWLWPTANSGGPGPILSDVPRTLALYQLNFTLAAADTVTLRIAADNVVSAWCDDLLVVDRLGDWHTMASVDRVLAAGVHRLTAIVSNSEQSPNFQNINEYSNPGGLLVDVRNSAGVQLVRTSTSSTQVIRIQSTAIGTGT